MKDAARRAALALEAYMAQVREAVANALAALDRATAQVADWRGRPPDALRPDGRA